MAYATPSDVAALNKARTLGVGQNPTLSDVQTYINMAAGEIDAILVNKGYSVPVSPSQTEAYSLLNSVNAKGAVAFMEEASPNSPNVDRARQAWDAAKDMLASQEFVMDLPMNTARSEPRGPWVTTFPSGAVYDPMFADRTSGDPANSPANPFFSRQQEY